MLGAGVFSVTDHQTITDQVVNVYHVQSKFYNGSMLLTFANGQTVQYERGYDNYAWIINATYSVTYATNGFGSTELTSVVLVNNP